MAIKGARPNEARVAPHLLVNDGERAIAFYTEAFGAEVLYQSPMPGGNGIHAQIRIAESTLLITTVGAGSENTHPGIGSPEALNGTSTILELYVDDVDTVYQRAVEAGATAIMPLMDTFFGDRYGQLRDPFGHVWGLATVLEELTPDQVEERMRQYMSQATI
jgi:PhnB protein